MWVEVGEELGLEQVDLRVVGAGGIFADVVAVLDGATCMRVALNAEVGEEADLRLGDFWRRCGWGSG